MSEKKYAVLIGNGEFPQDPNLQSLRCSIKDAKALNDVLRSPTHGLFDDSIVLANKAAHEILLELNKVLRRAEKNDLILIFYSGHGKLNTTGVLHLATVDTQIQYIDATSISVVRIRELMDTCPAKKMILILDCCYSGRVTGAYLKGSVDDHLQQVAGGNGSRGIYLLTASTAVQVAQEKEGDENSLLTKYLLEGIREAKADFDDDGFVTISDLFKYASDNITGQVPTKTDLNVQGDSLVIAKTGKGQGAQHAAELERLLYHRRRFRDRYIIGGLTVGGALGGGVAILVLRLLVSIILGPDRFLLPTLLLHFLGGAIVSGSMSLGMALTIQFWQPNQDLTQPITAGRWFRNLRNRSNMALLHGTIAFAVAYLFLSFVTNPKTAFTAAGATLLIGAIAGVGLGLAVYGLPTYSARLNVPGWIARTAIAGTIYALLVTPAAYGRITTLLNLTWGRDAFARAFAQSLWFTNVVVSSNTFTYLAIADAFLTGCALAAGTAYGLTKAANALASWVKNVQPANE